MGDPLFVSEDMTDFADRNRPEDALRLIIQAVLEP